jgi:hypothetical protein
VPASIGPWATNTSTSSASSKARSSIPRTYMKIATVATIASNDRDGLARREHDRDGLARRRKACQHRQQSAGP